MQIAKPLTEGNLAAKFLANAIWLQRLDNLLEGVIAKSTFVQQGISPKK